MMGRNRDRANSKDMSDRQLVHTCLLGEVDEFRKIVDKYKGKVMALAMSVLGNREDAEDACQNTFIHVYRHLDKFDMEKSFRPWLYAILFNQCRDQLRKRQRFFRFFKKVKTESLSSPRSPAADHPSGRFLSKQTFKDLTPKERTTLFLWALEGYTSEEIGNVLRCSASTARVHLFNARKKIKAILEKEHVSL